MSIVRIDSIESSSESTAMNQSPFIINWGKLYIYSRDFFEIQFIKNISDYFSDYLIWRENIREEESIEINIRQKICKGEGCCETSRERNHSFSF